MDYFQHISRHLNIIRNEDELLKFKYDLLNDVAIGAESNQGFSEIAFLEYMEPIISDASSLDNIELQQYRNKEKSVGLTNYFMMFVTFDKHIEK